MVQGNTSMATVHNGQSPGSAAAGIWSRRRSRVTGRPSVACMASTWVGCPGSSAIGYRTAGWSKT